MLLAMHEFQPIPTELASLVGPETAAQRDYIMWGLLARRANLPANIEPLDEADMRGLAERTVGWHQPASVDHPQRPRHRAAHAAAQLRAGRPVASR
jgi:hypothetical protein